MEKSPLYDWRGCPAEFTPNTRFESLGEVTITMPVEMAALLMGMRGPLNVIVWLPDGRKMDSYQCFYKIVTSGISDEVMRQLNPIKNLGGMLGRAAKQRADKLNQQYAKE